MKKTFEKGGKYLVKLDLTRSISLIEILNITETSVQIIYESGNTNWYENEETERWTIVEDVTDKEINKQPISSVDLYRSLNKPYILPCPVCNGAKITYKHLIHS